MARAKTQRLTVSRATIRRRSRAADALAAERAQKARAEQPETIGQARVWTRKCHRYSIAGLCPRCAAQAAYGHANGFADIKDPCSDCQPLVSAFPTPGPKGSKWRKILDKLEYMSETELNEWLDVREQGEN